MSATFRELRAIEEALYRRLYKALWEHIAEPGRQYQILHSRGGIEYLLRFYQHDNRVETQALRAMFQRLIGLDTPTARLLRHWPDTILLAKDDVWLIDYKATLSPWYTKRVNDEVQPFGQIYAASWENLRTLRRKLGLNIACLYWIPHYSRPLLCSPVDQDLEPQAVTRATERGSGTDYVSPDLDSWLSIFDFLETLGVPRCDARAFLPATWFVDMATKFDPLTLDYNPRDPWRKRDDRRAGWNWGDDFVAPPIQTGLDIGLSKEDS